MQNKLQCNKSKIKVIVYVKTYSHINKLNIAILQSKVKDMIISRMLKQ